MPVHAPAQLKGLSVAVAAVTVLSDNNDSHAQPQWVGPTDPPLALWRRGAHCVDHWQWHPETRRWQGGLQMPLGSLPVRARRVHCALWPGTPAGITSRCSFTSNWNADATRTWRQASFRL
jgi:hypothetical protein